MTLRRSSGPRRVAGRRVQWPALRSGPAHALRSGACSSLDTAVPAPRGAPRIPGLRVLALAATRRPAPSAPHPLTPSVISSPIQPHRRGRQSPIPPHRFYSSTAGVNAA